MIVFSLSLQFFSLRGSAHKPVKQAYKPVENYPRYFLIQHLFGFLCPGCLMSSCYSKQTARLCGCSEFGISIKNGETNSDGAYIGVPVYVRFSAIFIGNTFYLHSTVMCRRC